MYSLFMLTKFYPYGMGEAFIENEIKVLANSFKKIIIIACEVPENEKYVREIPSNVVAYKITSKNNNIQKIKDGIRGINRIINANEEIRSEYDSCDNLLQKLFLGYFEEKSIRIFNKIKNSNILNEIKDDQLILYSYWFFMTARVGIEIKKLMNKNIIYSFCRAHRYDLYSNKNPLSYLPYRKLFLENYNNIVPCSYDGEEYLKKRYPNYSKKIEASLLGTMDRGVANRSKDGIFRIVSCSRIEKVKRIERIVKSLSLLDNCGFKIEWTHIGSGKNFRNVEALVRKEIKNIHVNLLGDMPNDEVLRYYGAYPVDLFVNVSSSEGLPVSIMEVISFGIPVIATDVGGTSEIVINDENGYLIPADFTNESLSQLIKKIIMLSESDKYRSLCRRSREIWLEKFQAVKNYKLFYARIESKIEKLVDKIVVEE